MSVEERVLIAGAGPVGLVAAANLVRGGVPVTVLEAGSGLSEESRASTFHPPTLDMLDRLGAAQPLIAQGLLAPAFQYRTKEYGVLAQFDFGTIADVTGHPYRVQCEQSKLTRILYEQLRGHPDFELQFDAQVQEVSQSEAGVEVAIARPGVKGTKIETRSGRWLIGADGAGSNVRRSLGIPFEGFTWQERFLVVSTPFDFSTVIPDLVTVSYVTDPVRWHFLLQIPGLCRVMFPIAADESDKLTLRPDFAQSLMATVVPGIANYEIAHVTLYKVHQRVAKTFQRGRAFLVGDAAHINNPLGGMGMNGGIHDAINLTARLIEAWRNKTEKGTTAGAELERYDKQRRLVTLEYIEKQSIQNKQNLESDGTEFRRSLAEIAADKARTYDYLLRVSMIASLRRAQQLG
jgi:3-(3-hydroxy-phenyl)propionate hydroxylase